MEFSSSPVVEPRSSLSCCHRFYVLLKLHYFLFFSAFGMIYPVLSLVLRNRGLTDAEISLINAIVPFIVFFTNPLVGFIADRSRRYLLTFNAVLATVFILYGLLFVLPTIQTWNIQAKMLYVDQAGSVLDFCASPEVARGCALRSTCGCTYQANCASSGHDNQIDLLSFKFSMNSNKIDKQISNSGDEPQSTCGIEYRVPIDEALKANYPSRSIDSSLPSDAVHCEITCSMPEHCHGSRQPQQMHSITLYSLLFIFGSNLLANAITTGTSLGFASLPRPDIFGQQRLWGTIGFGASAWVTSYVYAYFRTDLVYIILSSTAAILCIIVTSFIRIQPSQLPRKMSNKKTEVSEKEFDDPSTLKKSSPTGLSALIPLFKKVDVLVFLSLTLIWGMSYSVLDPYLYLYIDAIAPCQSRSIVGRMSFVSASGELVALFLAGRILKRSGTSVCSIMILLAFAARFAGYYFIRQANFLIFMEALHFFNFGILFVLIGQQADAIAPVGLSGTLQGLAYGICFGLGRGIGILVSGYIYNRIGQRTLFASSSIFNLIAAVVFGVYFLISKRRSSEKSSSTNKLPKVISESDPNFNAEPLLVRSS